MHSPVKPVTPVAPVKPVSPVKPVKPVAPVKPAFKQNDLVLRVSNNMKHTTRAVPFQRHSC